MSMPTPHVIMTAVAKTAHGPMDTSHGSSMDTMPMGANNSPSTGHQIVPRPRTAHTAHRASPMGATHAQTVHAPAPSPATPHVPKPSLSPVTRDYGQCQTFHDVCAALPEGAAAIVAAEASLYTITSGKCTCHPATITFRSVDVFRSMTSVSR